MRRTIRHVDPWSVLKFSLLFYSSVMLVLLFAGAMLFIAADAAGIIDKFEAFVRGIGWPEWKVRPLQLFRIALLVGLANVIGWSAVNLFLSFLYNLVADVVGGISVTMSERDL